MSPELVTRLRRALRGVHPAIPHGPLSDEIAALMAELAPEPGGEMPEPWPGMSFEHADGRRVKIEDARPGDHFNPPLPCWAVVDNFERLYDWTPRDIREIRTPDGRVLWRAL